MPDSPPRLCRCACSSAPFCCGTASPLFYLLLLSFWEEHRFQSLLQVVTDLVLVTLVVHATGGVDSSLNFLYPLVIIVACILLPRVVGVPDWRLWPSSCTARCWSSTITSTFPRIPPPIRSFGAAGNHVRQLVRVSCGRISGGPTGGKATAGECPAEATSGALENLQALHENIIQSISGGLITTGSGWPHHPGQHRRADVSSGGRNVNCWESRSASCFWIPCRMSVLSAPMAKYDSLPRTISARLFAYDGISADGSRARCSGIRIHIR